MAPSFRRPLPAKDLRWRCAPSRFKWGSTAEAAPLMETIGQHEALEALRIGIELYGPGYNVYVAGLPGLGKSSLVPALLEEMTPRCAVPADRVYVNDFRHPERPRLLELPRGDGRAFADAMSRATLRVAEAIRRLSSDETFAKKREEVLAKTREEDRKLLDEFEAACRSRGFAPGAVQAGSSSEPEVFWIAGDKLISMGDLDDAVREGLVPAEKEAEIRAAYQATRELLASTMRRSRAIANERSRAFEELDREVAGRIVGEIALDLRARFPYPKIAAQLREAQEHFVKRFSTYARALLEASEGMEGRSDALGGVADEVFRDFGVNLLLDAHATKGCPVVVEAQPSWTHVFGQIERDVDARGNSRTDFRQIRAGSLLRADGGYLVLQARDVVEEEGVWVELKRVLKHRLLEIRLPDAMMAASPIVLQPEPIRVNVKVILIGDEATWAALRDADPDFAEIFKVKATFERDTPLSDESLHHYASFFQKLAKEEGLLHLDRTGLAAMAEEGVREAGRRGRLSVRFGRMSDLVREADYAARRRGADAIAANDVREALRLAARRMGVEERRMRRDIREGLILVQTKGTHVGQVNGLAVYDFGYLRFGKVARITAAVGAGQVGIVNVERLAALSGSTHDKGVLILSGWMRATFGAERPLAFAASLVFEQSYGGVDGDSATCAEVFAILSALAGLPVRQDLAVTGSMNQFGDVQAVGGLNDKVEGFFDVCNEQGLTGTQGVILPRSNVDDLMLRPDVVEACAAKKFAIHAIDRVEQGIELLTGVPAGVTGVPGRFKKGSVFARVAERLARLAKAAKDASPPTAG